MDMQAIIIGAVVVGLVIQSIVLAVVLSRTRHASPHTAQAPAQPTPQELPTPQLTPDQLQRLEQTAEAAFTGAVDRATQQFGSDLGATSKRLNDLIVKLTTDVVERELEQYQGSLSKAREDALASLANMQAAIDKHREGLLAGVDSELTKRRDYLTTRLDQQLGTAVAAYIVESLGQGADLGAQRNFLIENLERHKDELKQEITGGNSTK